LSFFLFTARKDLAGRSAELSGTVASMVGKLENESGTTYKSRINFTPGEGDQAAKETGSLSWNEYRGARDKATGEHPAYTKLLGEAVRLATDINEQRNALAQSLATVAADMKIPETDLDPTALTNLAESDQFTKSSNRILSLSKAVVGRDEAMIQTLLTCARAIDFDLPTSSFRDRDENVDEDGVVSLGDFKHSAPLLAFSGEVSGINERCNEYAKTIVDGVSRVNKFKWETQVDQISDKEQYGSVCTSLLNDFEGLNQQLVQFEQARNRITSLKVQIEELEEEQEAHKEEIADLNRKVEDLKRLVAGKRIKAPPPGTPGAKPVDIDPDIEGKIVQVNDEWNFVVLNLGREKGVDEEMEMLVARADDLVARLQISKVLRKICIAEILPEVQTASVKVGDRVILPDKKVAPPKKRR
ncbi:MAG: hypothetical protein HON70_26210, partial [Lentisphaerae bacterium]|nr:hypothetical protein [Lentisphaerota bacterium]